MSLEKSSTALMPTPQAAAMDVLSSPQAISTSRRLFLGNWAVRAAKAPTPSSFLRPAALPGSSVR
jgi:hypothetical protein